DRNGDRFFRLFRLDAGLKRGNGRLVPGKTVLVGRAAREWHLDPLRDVGVFQRPGGPQDAREAVIVGRRDWVELVVVTAGAGNRLPEQPFADDVKLLVHDVHPQLDLVLFFQVGVAEHEEPGGDQLAAAVGGRLGRQ